ncbi:putative HVA22-like protein g [Salvia miltiorrhiza]|uniref:putative HVA22-like protein g n=1 Tax=Salvia miltiorrhiza TaxID=226208 RepID=UPI0025ACD4E3|nr:putative HVA22-like protein g [Salvia miltiorrhiza]XP_057794807.1 putative HVA22-like protein g [Salvia miltiorrhiza]
MIGSFLTRALVLIFGYVYPAYECFKTVEMNKPDISQLRFWCQYWILVAGLTVCERIGDMFIGWVPMYGEAKLAFFIYLWFPKTKGTAYVYDSFFRPYVAKHETEIDRNLLELRLRAGDMAVSYWQKVANYGQTRIFDILQYIASQSTPPRPVQRVEKPGMPSTRTSTVASQPQNGQPGSPASDASLSEQLDDSTDEAGPLQDSKAKAVPAVLSEQKTTPTLPLVETAKSSTSSEVQVMQVDSVPPVPKEAAAQPPPQEVVMEEPVRVTRARSRRTRAPSSDR